MTGRPAWTRCTADDLAPWLVRCGALALFRRFVYRRSLVTVLCLHRVSRASDALAPSLSPELLRALCRFVARHYRVVRFCDLASESVRVGPRPLLVLSFDDGYLDFFENAMPILLEQGLRANLNVSSECADSGEPYLWQRCIDLLLLAETTALGATLEALGVGIGASSRGAVGLAFTRWFHEQSPGALQALAERANALQASRSIAASRMMRWEHVREADRLGFEIGSHTVSHASLDALPQALLEREMAVSKSRLEAELGHPVQVLAFPAGRHNPAVRAAARTAGYRYLLGTGGTLNPLSASVWERILVYGDSEARLAVRTSGLEGLLMTNPLVDTLAQLLLGRARSAAPAG